MHPRKLKAGELGVIEDRTKPAIHDVALLAGDGKTRRAMVWKARLHKGLGMASHTFR